MSKIEKYCITGGRSLQGEVSLPAAKNSVLPILAAALLCAEPVSLLGAPRMADVATSVQLLRALGARVQWRRGRLTVQPAPGGALGSELPAALAAAMRSSVFYLSPLLARTGCVTMPLPGGCNLGPRLIDIHLDGLSKMGARVQWQPNTVTLRRRRALQGIDYTLRLPSVGATETLLMAAAVAEGGTVLRNAACEPEVKDLADFLCCCGADIHGAGTPLLRVRGTPCLHGAVYAPLPDRIVGATLACAAAAAGGSVLLRGVQKDNEGMRIILEILRRAGCGVSFLENGVLVERTGRLAGAGFLETAAWPGFATDAAPLAAAAFLCAAGETVIRDNLFENRFACAAGFAAMGAGATVSGREIRLRGVPCLHGASVTAPDLRGGAALMLAALATAPGDKTLLLDSGHIRRGYPDLAAALCALGADISKVR